MNILIVERELNPVGGGVQRVSYVLGEEFSKHNIGVHYSFVVSDSDTGHIPQSNKIKLWDLTDEDYLYNELKDYCVDNDINIIINQNVYSKALVNVFSKLRYNTKIKIIQCLHANPDQTINKNLFRLTTLKQYATDSIKSLIRIFFKNKYICQLQDCYNSCDKYVLLSQYYIPVFQRVTHIEDDLRKLCGINNPCTFDETDIKKSIKENIILMVGRLSEGQKRVSNILSIWKILESRLPDWKIVIVGDGPDYAWYVNRAKKLGLTRINFVGQSSDVSIYYQQAKIFLMTSIWEGLPMTLLEAQMYGCVPVVFNNFEAIHDIIEDGVNGTIVESKDGLKAFASRVEELALDNTLYMNMSTNAVLHIQKKFNKNYIVNQWLELFGSIK